MNVRIAIVAFASIFIGIGTFTLLNPSNEKKEISNKIELNTSKIKNGVPIVERPHVPKPDAPPKNDISQEPRFGEIDTPEKPDDGLYDSQVFFDGLEERGYFSKKQLEVYESYETPTLESLSTQGDLRAITTLFQRYVKKGDYDKVKTISNLGAVHGSTLLLKSIGASRQGKYTSAVLNGESADRNALISALAYYDVAIHLGDYAAEDERSQFLKRYDIQLDHSDLELIRNRSIEILNDLNSQRNKLGLQDFATIFSK